MSESASPESGPLSVDQAIAAIAPEHVEEQAPEAPLEAAEEPAEPEGEPDAQTATEDGAETPAEEEEAAEEPEPVKLDAPLYWKPEAKAKFALLDPDLQAEILGQEGPREESAAKAKAEAATQIERANSEVAKVQALAAELAEFLPKAIETFQQRWGEPDWAAVTQEHGAEKAFILKAQFETEQKQLAQVAQASQTAQIEARKAFLNTEWKVLGEIAPELTEPTTGPVKRQAVVDYLVADGIPKDAVDQISAREMRIAHKAMLYDQITATAATKPKPAPAAPTPRATARPSAAVPQSSSRSSLQAAQSRFNLNPSPENAQALMLAKG